MANSFSLLPLPDRARLRVLRCMDGTTLFLFSLVSQKTKEMVRCLQLQPSDIVIWIQDDICLAIDIRGFSDLHLTFSKENEQYMDMLKKPANLWIRDADETNMKLSNSLELKEWIKYLFYIYDCRREPAIIFDEGCERFEYQAIKNTFGKLRSLEVLEGATNESIDIMDCFLPDIDELDLAANPFDPDDIDFQKVLMGNFTFLNLGEEEFESFTLNDLLVSNAPYIEHELPQDPVFLNRFLKLWMKGACPNLIRLCMNNPKMISESIFKGVNVLRRIPADEDIIFNGTVHGRGIRPERIAAEIGRFDGTRATVYIAECCFFFHKWIF
ncbi:unnamed protein product [Caenorhabditis brenneri]